jgi:hypothetical protein
LVEIDENLDKLEFDYNASLFNITINNPGNTRKNVLSDKNACPKGESIDKTVKVTCLRDFAESQLIKIWAYPVGVANKRDAKLAGAILVNKNDALTRKQLKFVYVKVKTDIDGPGGANPVTGDDATVPHEKANLKNALYHSLVIADIENSPQTLDLSSDPDYQIGGQFFISNFMYHGLNEDAPNFFQNLKALFLNDTDASGNLINSQYNSGYFFIFAFGADAYDGIAGQVEDIGTRNLILFPPRNDKTLAHESMHGLGLYHTHRDSTPITEPEIKYIYLNANMLPQSQIADATDNIMSYAGNLRKTTWRWQWDIIKNNIR